VIIISSWYYDSECGNFPSMDNNNAVLVNSRRLLFAVESGLSSIFSRKLNLPLRNYKLNEKQNFREVKL